MPQYLVVFMPFLYYVVLFTPEQPIELFLKCKELFPREETLHDSAGQIDKCLEEELVLFALLRAVLQQNNSVVDGLHS